MSVFRKILDFLSKSAAIDRAQSPEIARLVDFEKRLHHLLDTDNYIARSDYEPLFKEYKDIYEHFSALKKSDTLDYFCSQNHVNSKQIISFIDIYNGLGKNEGIDIIDSHNKQYVKRHLASDKRYLDNILKPIDPAINLDDDQRRVVLSDEDYTLVIAGAGAGKTTTVAAKVKYLVEKKHIRPEQILVISFTNKAVDELRSRMM